ncbi:polysaccharide biosynthesis protein [Desulfoplanes sp. PS50]
MLRQLLNRNLYLVLGTDLLVFSLALILSFWIRFDFEPEAQYLVKMWALFPVMVPVKIAVMFIFGLYQGMWRYTDIRDSWALLKAVVISEITSIALLYMLGYFSGFPRSIFLIDGVLSFVLAGGVRVAVRTFYLHRGNFSAGALLPGKIYVRRCRDLHRVLIVGAGNAGEKVLREIIENPELGYQVVGFLDDRGDKQGRSVHGVPVLGTIDDVTRIASEQGVHEILIAIPTATGTQMRRVVGACKSADIRYKTLPSIGNLIDGSVSINQFRDVSYEDLLGRQPVRLENAAISAYLTDKIVMITGAGGSIGSELVRQVIKYEPKLVILYERGEHNLYSIQMQMEYEMHFTRYVPVLGRVQDQVLMDKIMKVYHPEVVFHAAAYKHVPMVECNPWEAIYNNIWGSHVVMETAENNRVDRFVLVSTDKAVRPTNVMGASKRATELLMQSRPGGHTKFMAVRFGNVVGSSGSVIPLFKQQIRQGGPVTVTHPEMTRYFMTIPEACQLIIQAGTMGRGGEIFILKMGTPVRIADMARDLIRLSGREPELDIPITYTGLRPGEKLFEELITHGEGVVDTEHEEIMVLRPENDGQVLDPGYREILMWQIEELIAKAKEYDAAGIKDKLQNIVPEYSQKKTGCVLVLEEGR